MDIKKIISKIPGMNAEQRAGVRTNAERLLGGPETASAAQQVLAALDRQTEAEADAMSQHVRDLPVAKRVVEAFRHEPLTETEHKLVQVLLDHPRSTSEQLSQALGWGAQSWHMHFGIMCKNRQARLWPAEPAETRDANFYSGILADIEDDRWWTMKPDVAEAFAALGLRAQTSP